ncbi:hypothetical protein EVAR_68312_1 [Eumeta japonica]|uniref:Uncharacterized protein n=1 Tax=Eumeta variegata TaxID=151549 RepID=A0A4C2AE57_EUMVA|nr:hypothetical protein EVAR_68312_1 [Eumeta japonica]
MKDAQAVYNFEISEDSRNAIRVYRIQALKVKNNLFEVLQQRTEATGTPKTGSTASGGITDLGISSDGRYRRAHREQATWSGKMPLASESANNER